ncbi:hypothetical protein [Mycobacterium sp. URHB0021]
MTIVIANAKIEHGSMGEDVLVSDGGSLTLFGMINGTLTVGTGGYAHVCGTVGRLVVEPGGKADLDGTCSGDAHNQGGELTIKGRVAGSLVGKIGTRVSPEAQVGG